MNKKQFIKETVNKLYDEWPTSGHNMEYFLEKAVKAGLENADRLTTFELIKENEGFKINKIINFRKNWTKPVLHLYSSNTEVANQILALFESYDEESII